MTHQQANRLAAFCREHSMPARVERISWSGAYVVRFSKASEAYGSVDLYVCDGVIYGHR